MCLMNVWENVLILVECERPSSIVWSRVTLLARSLVDKIRLRTLDVSYLFWRSTFVCVYDTRSFSSENFYHLSFHLLLRFHCFFLPSACSFQTALNSKWTQWILTENSFITSHTYLQSCYVLVVTFYAFHLNIL